MITKRKNCKYIYIECINCKQQFDTLWKYLKHLDREAGVWLSLKITNEHLKLLERANWEFNDCEYGAPAIDYKRPYGNGDVEDDIATILGWDLFENKYGETQISKEQSDKAEELHHDLLEVIPQIIKEFTNAWRKAKGV